MLLGWVAHSGEGPDGQIGFVIRIYALAMPMFRSTRGDTDPPRAKVPALHFLGWHKPTDLYLALCQSLTLGISGMVSDGISGAKVVVGRLRSPEIKGDIDL